MSKLTVFILTYIKEDSCGLGIPKKCWMRDPSLHLEAQVGSIQNATYPNGLPYWGTYLGTLKNKSIRIIDNIVKVINN